jgi:hypothetical protein
MLAKRSMYHTAVEEDLGSIGYVVEDLKRLFKLVIVIVCQCLHPCFDFLIRLSGLDLMVNDSFVVPTCFKDIS